MTKRGFAIAAALFFFVGAAAGDEAADLNAIHPLLDADEVRSELFGVDLRGYALGGTTLWRECIEPDGETLFVMGGEMNRGRLTVEDDGSACFTYEDGAPNCFRVARAGEGYMFLSLTRYVASQVRRGIRACAAEDGIS